MHSGFKSWKAMVARSARALLIPAAIGGIALSSGQAGAIDLYLKGGIAGNVIGESEIGGTNVTDGRVRFGVGFTGSAAVGTAVGPVRLELEGTYGISPASELDAASITTSIGTFVAITGIDAGGEIHVATGMANVFYDIRTRWPQFTPFIGGGFGLAHFRASDLRGVVGGAGFTISDDADIALAYQAQAGFTYTFGPRMALEVAYRHVRTLDALGIDGLRFDDDLGGSFSAEFAQHRFMLSLRYYL